MLPILPGIIVIANIIGVSSPTEYYGFRMPITLFLWIVDTVVAQAQ